MKRANGQGTIKKRKNGTWEAQYVAGRDENGRVIRKSVYGKTQKEVAEKLTALTNQINTGTYIHPDKIKVAEWADTWLAEYNNGVKGSTLTQYEYNVRVHIKPGIGSYMLQRVNAPILQKFINTEFANGLSAKSCRNIHGILNKMFNQAVKCEMIRSNPVPSVDLPRVEKKEMNILQGESLTAFLSEIKGKKHENIFFVDVFTGLREAEIIGLTWDCVDFQNGIIHVDKQLKRKDGTHNDYHFDTLKNGKKRIVSPAPVVFDVLKKVKTAQAENRLRYGEAFHNDLNLVFTDELGHHIGIEGLWQCFKRRATAIGKPDLRFHDLRHTFATISIQNGDDIKTVSENMGHATVAFTLDVYGHVTEKMRKDSADRMQSFYESLGG